MALSDALKKLVEDHGPAAICDSVSIDIIDKAGGFADYRSCRYAYEALAAEGLLREVADAYSGSDDLEAALAKAVDVLGNAFSIKSDLACHIADALRQAAPRADLADTMAVHDEMKATIEKYGKYTLCSNALADILVDFSPGFRNNDNLKAALSAILADGYGKRIYDIVDAKKPAQELDKIHADFAAARCAELDADSVDYIFYCLAYALGWDDGKKRKKRVAPSAPSAPSSPASPAPSPANAVNGYEWVDLGLPSGTLWATHNVGASQPGEPGCYFAWGEVQEKDSYDCANSLFYDQNASRISGSPLRDAATAHWGKPWKMPLKKDCLELIDNCGAAWKTMGGTPGILLTSRINGNSIFIPAGGNIVKTDFEIGSRSRFCNLWLGNTDDCLRKAFMLAAGPTFPPRVQLNPRNQGLNIRPILRR